ncbi:MAG: tRNA dihydrouridine synthase DusB [Candidatus Omnitrophota bacterium]|nr:tRNA dihydrouridine synthase DusB [Candidatus Omnitrophota bacterium]
MLKIGSLKLKSNLILAPMAGITDLPFRMLNRSFGCELAFVEMINVRSASHKSRKTKQMLFAHKRDRPLGVQILGCEKEYIDAGLDVVDAYKFDVLDFNAACPVKKVTRRGEGASLLKDPKKLAGLLKLVIKKSRVPVTVKIRSGWDNVSINAVEVARRCCGAGVSAIFIHGRTKEQGYAGAVDYATIAAVKKAVKIPVIASGDILSAQLAKTMFERTACDGILLARGALGNPWLFKQISQYLKDNKTDIFPDAAQLRGTIIKHLDMCVDFYTEGVGVMIFRKFFAWYTKGLRKIRPLRERSSRAKTKKEMLEIIRESLPG